MRTQARRDGRRSTRRNRTERVNRIRLRLELLEDRSLLSGGYSYQAIAFLGDRAPGGGQLTHAFDFEPGSINNLGQAVFGSDLNDSVGNDIGEGVFLRRGGHTIALGRVGDKAPRPDTATLSFAFYGELVMNQAGDAPFVFQREPATFVDTNGDGTPDSLLFGDNAGLYFFDHDTGKTTARLLPGAAAPGGGTFHGFGFRAGINNGGDIAFGGLTTPETVGPGTALNGGQGLGQGVYLMNSEGEISKVVRPGDRAPGGKTFDWAQLPWVNDRGDLVFEGHIKEDPCIQFNPANIPGVQLFCLQSLYARDASTGRIRSIAHIGDKAPGGREPFASAYGGKENNSGQIVFIGGMAADPAGTGHLPLDINTGIFLNSGGRTIAIARPGDAMPGGGTLLTAAAFTNDVWINDAGVISFSAVITDINGDGQEDNGMYLWSEGTLSLVAHTGTVIPGVGTINALKPPALVGVDPRTISGAAINDQGQVLFTAALTDGRGVLLVATPDTNGAATVTSSAKAASSTASTGLVEAIGTWVAGNRANTPSIPAVNAALASAASPAGLSGEPVAYSSLNSAPLGGTASGGSPSYAALDQLFADLVNDTLLNGLAHAGL